MEGILSVLDSKILYKKEMNKSISSLVDFFCIILENKSVIVGYRLFLVNFIT